MRNLFSTIVLSVFLAGSSVYGAALTWVGSTSTQANLNTASNWSPTQIPTSTDQLTLSPTGGKYTGNLSLADGGSISISEADSTSANYYTIFYNDFTMTGGTVNFDAKRVLAGIVGTNNTWNISGGTVNYTHQVGSKNGTFRFGVTWAQGTGVITPTAETTNTLNISGTAKFNADRFILGYVGSDLTKKQTANMTVSDSAAVKLGGDAGGEYSYIGRGNANLEANLTLKDSATLTGGGNFIVGWDNGLGTVTLNGNSKFSLTAGNLTVGSNSTQANKITVGGTSTLEITNGITLGSMSGNVTTGTGTLEVSGGTAKANWINVSVNGASLAGTGKLDVTAGTLNVSGNLNVYKGGTLTVSGGTGSTIGTLNVHSGAEALFSGGVVNISTINVGANGTLNITDAAQLTYTNFNQNALGIVNVNLGETGKLNLPNVYGKTNLNGGTVSRGGDLLIHNADATNGAVLTVNKGSLNVGSQIQIAFNAENLNGKLVVNDGSVSAQYLQIANKTTSSGDLEITGGTVSTSQGVRIGRNGTGTLTMSGGTLKVGTAGDKEKALIFGYEGADSDGTLTMTGGTIDTTSQAGSAISIGRQGTGTANVSQAEGKTTLIKTENLHLGEGNGSSGTWTQSGGELQANIVYIANQGEGEFTQTGGKVNANYTVVGVNQSGSLSISGEGTTYSGKSITVGKYDGTTGTLSLSDSAKLTLTDFSGADGTLQVGNRGNGEVSIKDATFNAKNLYIGYKNDQDLTGNFGTGSVTAENSKLTLTNDIYVGAVGGGEITLKNCTTSTQFFCMGWNGNASKAVATIEGGKLNVTANLRIGYKVPGTMNVVGDAVITASKAAFPANSTLNFVMKDGKLGQLKINEVHTDGLNGTITADFGEGLQFVTDDSWTLVDKKGSIKLTDSDYFKISADGTSIVAKLREDSTLPDDKSQQGIRAVEDSPKEMTLGTGLGGDEEKLTEFVDWLNATNEDLDATILDALKGYISVAVPEGASSMLWDFRNSGTTAILQAELNPPTSGVPEPSTWALLLLGLTMISFRAKRY